MDGFQVAPSPCSTMTLTWPDPPTANAFVYEFKTGLKEFTLGTGLTGYSEPLCSVTPSIEIMHVDSAGNETPLSNWSDLDVFATLEYDSTVGVVKI